MTKEELHSSGNHGPAELIVADEEMGLAADEGLTAADEEMGLAADEGLAAADEDMGLAADEGKWWAGR
jgi:hypothetical protein